MLKKGEKSPKHKVLPMGWRDQALPRRGSRVESVGHRRVCPFGFPELHVPGMSTARMVADLLFCICSLKLRCTTVPSGVALGSGKPRDLRCWEDTQVS